MSSQPLPNENVTAEAVVRFWFDSVDGVSWPVSNDVSASLGTAYRRWWFRSSRAIDAAIGARFGPGFAAALHALSGTTGTDELASAAFMSEWCGLAIGRLGLILLLDQIPRHVHRGQALAFAGDAHARAISESALSAGDDVGSRWGWRAYLYMPWMHSEQLPDQERAVALFSALLAQVDPNERAEVQRFLNSAKEHRDIIARFGRFPHRNQILGRSSTAEEEGFLRRRKGSFGQSSARRPRAKTNPGAADNRGDDDD